MRSLGLLETKITPKLRTMVNYCDGCAFCGAGGGTLVGGCSGCGDGGGVSTGGGFQRSYDDLTP